MKVFLTGGTGFLGRHVLAALARKNHSVLLLHQKDPDRDLLERSGVRCLEGRLDGDWASALAECDTLLHLAAVGVSPKPATWRDYFAVNVVASLNLMVSAVEAGVRRIVLCGSGVEFGMNAERYDRVPDDAPLAPVGGYAASKAAASLAAIGLCQERGFELALLRPFHIYGEGQYPGNFWPQLQRAAISGCDFPMTAGEQVRDYLKVERCAEVFAEAVERPDLKGGQPWIRNVGSGLARSIREFAQEEWIRLGATGRILFGALPYRPNEVMAIVPAVREDLWCESSGE